MEHFLYPTLKEPEEVFGFLQACLEESRPGVLGLGIGHVIKANTDLPFIAYLVVCSFSQHLLKEDILEIMNTLKSSIPHEYQEYLADLYWWLHLLDETLLRGGLKQMKIKAEIETLNIPEQFKILPEYKQWEKITAVSARSHLFC